MLLLPVFFVVFCLVFGLCFTFAPLPWLWKDLSGVVLAVAVGLLASVCFMFGCRFRSYLQQDPTLGSHLAMQRLRSHATRIVILAAVFGLLLELSILVTQMLSVDPMQYPGVFMVVLVVIHIVLEGGCAILLTIATRRRPLASHARRNQVIRSIAPSFGDTLSSSLLHTSPGGHSLTRVAGLQPNPVGFSESDGTWATRNSDRFYESRMSSNIAALLRFRCRLR